MITVAIATTGRPSCEQVLEALARQTVPRNAFLVAVAENAPHPSLRPLVRRFSSRLSLVYHARHTPGKAHALNAVIRATESPFLAFTDDDCLPAPTWLERILHVFATHSDAAVVSGRFTTIDALPLPVHTLRGIHEPRAFTIRGTTRRPWEILRGGNFAVRRQVFDHVGLFDPDFGPGAPISSGDESEWLLRVLIRGERVRYDPAIQMVHTPPWGQPGKAEQRAGEYYASTGAIIAKHLLAGELAALSLINPRTYFSGSGWNFFARLATATRTIPHLCAGAARYLRHRARLRGTSARLSARHVALLSHERASGS